MEHDLTNLPTPETRIRYADHYRQQMKLDGVSENICARSGTVKRLEYFNADGKAVDSAVPDGSIYAVIVWDGAPPDIFGKILLSNIAPDERDEEDSGDPT